MPRGLDNNKVYYQHALKNTMLPVITVGGADRNHGGLHHPDRERVPGPGTGFLFLEAIHRVDTPLITAYVIFVGLIFVVTNTPGRPALRVDQPDRQPDRQGVTDD